MNAENKNIRARPRSSASHKLRLLVLAHVFPRTPDDTMGAFLLHLADTLADCGISADVVAPHASGLADEETIGAARVHRFHYAPARWERLAYAGTMHEFVARGIHYQFLFALFIAAFLLKTHVVVRAARPQIIHAHWWLPGGLVGALAALLTRTPLVITTHGTDIEMLRRTRWATPLARFTFSRARAITCGSTYLREQLLELGAADAARVSVVPMPVNSEFETQLANYELRITNSLLTVARLTKQKSIDTLIEAMAHLPDARLTIIGDGPERAALEEQTHDANLQDRVKFLGALPQSELPNYYARCSGFVLPSIREGMGLVLAEALLCGAPVVAANSGGVTDIVKDGETGLLFPEGDAAALAAAISKLLNDPALAKRLAANGRVWVRERFTPKRVATQFTQIYSDVGNLKSQISNL
ncbi:MAG: glycosyltransferase [Chloroflexi bacterium]|nr:glycosyltransferase [Chloroflexota bacterium]